MRMTTKSNLSEPLLKNDDSDAAPYIRRMSSKTKKYWKKGHRNQNDVDHHVFHFNTGHVLAD